MLTELDALARFAKLLATAPSSGEVQELLVESAVAFVGADGAVLVLVDAAGTPRVVARRSFDVDVTLAPDLLGVELTDQLLASSRGQFTFGAPLPLIAAGGLYGVLVLLFIETKRLDEEQLQLAATIVDIVAATLARAREVDALERVYDELKASRRVLAQTEKLRALGGMAAGISHDLRNVFAPMLLLLEVLKRSTVDGDAMRARVERMRRPLNSGLAIVERLREYSRPPGDDAREISPVQTIVEDAVDLCRPRISHAAARVDIVVEASEAPLVRVEVAASVAAVTNLVVNALDAVSAQGGVVTVHSGARGEGAFIEVTDTGPGVPPELQERIFEEFFTTKGKSGTGLGLALVHDFAQRHGGSLQLECPATGGARFTLWLPAARDSEAA